MSVPPYFNLSLAKGLAILELIAARNGALTLTDIARTLNLDKATAKRFLSTLIDLGYITSIPVGKTFAVSLKTVQLGYSALSGLAWREIARAYLEELHNEIQETVSASTLDGDSILYVIRLPKPGVYIHGAIGMRRPAYISSMGKMLLALEPNDVMTRIVGNMDMVPLTPYTLRSHEALLLELEQTKLQGYAVSDQEFSEFTRSIAVPIIFRNRPVAAFNVAVLVENYTLEQLVETVLPRMRHYARQISNALDQTECELPPS
ncbi:Transcriptional regulator, IclR family [uncultured delta proteobacterium]|uniref:Transcriptional regulator, IclR family n=1 Tax=uncultured delta proteobacterium TaxID=34034 RepID=A0A212K2E3_9DELT|nr:Transcriptional regulator, IclR family [uncultured delta proteobacterium]